MNAFPAGHGWTPHARFATDKCRVQLVRYPCPYGKNEHDPDLPPVDVDAFGYPRPGADTQPVVTEK